MEKKLTFNLEVDKINSQADNLHQCQFRLSWGQKQKISPIFIHYPQELISHDYLQWKRVYSKYYQQLCEIEKLTKEINKQEIQGNIKKLAKKITKNREILPKLESILLNNFNKWLNNEKLFNISQTIINEIKKIETNSANHKSKNNQANLGIKINIFIICNCRELERLPWEKWQFKKMDHSIKIRWIRSPSNVRSNFAKLRNQPARILAIFGDSTELNLDKENKLLSSLNTLVKKLEIISWDKDKYQSITKWRSKICDIIADNKGWDMLFFFGHSEENTNTGGKLGIAPNEYISIKDISPYLTKAQNKGLQFALFNSCSGLDIANSLIDLGLNQVVIMREPLPDIVAPVFFQEFLTGLAKEKNVSDVLSETCEIIKQKINYPSVYLIPSLFGHPSASFYQLKPLGWKAKLKEWLPNRQQTLAISFLSLISLFPFVQEFLLDKRLFTQAIYRDLTQPITDNHLPPIILIYIDEESLIKGNITQRNPIDRKYLAQIIDSLTSLNIKNISIDYLLDFPQVKNDSILAKSIQNAIEKNGTLFIFASVIEGEKETGILPNIASLNTVMQGSIEVSSNYYIPLFDNCYHSCPFTYLTVVNQRLSEIDINADNFSLEKDYKTQLLNYFYQTSYKNSELNFLKQVKISPLTKISQYFRQHWLQPIIDYSLPPSTIYQVIPAWQLLETNDNLVENKINLTNENSLKNKIILIASGGYKEAGIDDSKDYFSLPFATKFWQLIYDYTDNKKFTGGEVNAYIIHHWLTQHLIISLPDLWLILVAGLLAKSLEKYLLFLNIHSENSLFKLNHNNLKFNIFYFLISANLVYFSLSLQIYITFNLILPVVLPSLSFWIYFLFRSNNYENS